MFVISDSQADWTIAGIHAPVAVMETIEIDLNARVALDWFV